MSLTEEVSFDKEGHIERFPLIRRVFLSLLIILVAGLSFGIGRLTSVSQKDAIKIKFDSSLEPSGPTPLETGSNPFSNGVVGSKNSNKYHYSSCPGAKQIAEKNKVTFASAVMAEASGYTLAANCKTK